MPAPAAATASASTLSLFNMLHPSHPQVMAIIRAIDTDQDGCVSYDELKTAVLSHTFYRLRTGRYNVALSLAEAETLRKRKVTFKHLLRSLDTWLTCTIDPSIPRPRERNACRASTSREATR